jgi:hypothetical protein
MHEKAAPRFIEFFNGIGHIRTIASTASAEVGAIEEWENCATCRGG